MSTERLDVLRERNKDLLIQLKHQTERLQELTSSKGTSGTVQSIAVASPTVDGSPATDANPVPTSLQNKLDQNQTDVMVTLGAANRGTARAALSKHSEKVNADVTALSEIEPGTPSESADDSVESVVATTPRKTSTPSPMIRTTQHGPVGVKHAYTGLLKDRGNSRPAVHTRSLHSSSRPSLRHQRRERRQVGRVTFQSPREEQESALDRHRLQPLLGYDWIAGVLDTESSLIDRSEEFFSDLRMFRQVNREECVHNQHVGLSEEDALPSHSSPEEQDTQLAMDTHECTFCYRINNRLFATPLDSKEACPVCKTPRAQHSHTAAEPAFIRVSIPRSTLLPAYQYKAHRRSSFDPSDSMGLPSHCLSGWSNTAPSSGPQTSNLDLRSSLDTAPPSGLASTQPQSFEQLEDLSVSRVSGSTRSDQLLNVSRLARYRFQRLPLNSRPRGTAYPVL